MRTSQVLRSSSEEETRSIGLTLGETLQPPRVVLLSGELGAGKTVLTQAMAAGLEVEDLSLVRSPSFTLINEYPSARGRVYHVDLYRLEGADDFHSIGLEEILDREAVVIIEWGEKLDLPVNDPVRVRILVDPVSDERLLEIDFGQERG
ncbi:MAG: tRNA (adenosine(37)-N6)-threonylcarbamoyltransferase complex ATPase subunit type 1 TsaE [Acidobacteriota bacterium]|nr:tRNA (adenosine(37)-N6)-threonylcarbamoyltransferase complex ATPase subunit type 1 TsaE [Acidobacteriota bacterium]